MPKVLVVDDEETVVALIVRLLQKASYEVIGETSPQRALARAESGERFDLAVLDVVMPDLSGDALAAALRQHDPDLPVLYVTGFDEALFQARPVLWERESFLVKPFTNKGLYEAVSIALYGRTLPPDGTSHQ